MQRVSSKHRNFMSFFRFVLKGISCAQNKNFWSFCTEVKRFWKLLNHLTQYLSRLVTALTGTKWIKVLDLCTVLFQVTTIFTSCHFTCMHQRGVPAILMADDITKFIIFFFILIQSCKITIYIFHLGELED